MKTMFNLLLLCSLFLSAFSCKKSDPEKMDKKPPVVTPPVDPPKEEPKKGMKIKSAAELAALSLKPGDTVIMQPGSWVDQSLVLKGTGTKTAPIVLKAETGGTVVLKGKSSLKLDGAWLVADGLSFKEGYTTGTNVVDFTAKSTNCRLTNTSIIDYNPPAPSTDYRWVSINGSYNRVDHCYLKGKMHAGPTVVLWGASTMHHQIDHNYFGSRPELGENGGETIRVGTSDWSMSASFTTIEENIFEHCDGEMEIISNKMSYNTIRNNLFYESKGTLCLRHGNNSDVYGNYFIGNNVKDAGGIRIIGDSHKVYNNYLQNIAGTGQRSAIVIMDGVPNSPLNGYYQVKYTQIIGNTVVNSAQAFDIGSGKGGNNRIVPPADCTIANNLIKSSSGIALSFTDNPVNFKYEGNIAFGMSGGSPLPAGFTVSDPKLKANDLNVYELSEGSPALGAFKGLYSFFQSPNAGADRPDEQHRDLLKAKGIGPAWMSGLGNNLDIKAL